MNKAELIEAIASDASLTKADARRALDAFVGATSKSLKQGKSVALIGFGSFSISKRKALRARGPVRNIYFSTPRIDITPVIEKADEDEGGYIGYIAEIPGVNTQGETIEEVTENLEDALLLIIEVRKEELMKSKKATIYIPSKKYIRFKAGADLSSAIA